MRRVGWSVNASRPGAVFEHRGREQWELVKSLLPAGWQLDGKRVLDFGCGVGRILRHAIEEDGGASYWGCDIDAPSLEWVTENLSPSLRVFQTAEWPPIPQPDLRFELIYAFSVFTHLVEAWSAWLLELHRLLEDDGLLIATVFGPGHKACNGESFEEDAIGMNVLFPAASWDAGGPLVLHSEWWLRAHWGRAFEILELRHGDPGGSPPLYGQGIVVMRKRPGVFTTDGLERPEPDDPREFAALKQNILSLRNEVSRQAVCLSGPSWRLTAPLRASGRLVRRTRRRLARGDAG